MTNGDYDYYLDLAIEAAEEYVRNKEGIEWHGEDRLNYSPIIRNDKEFHVFAFFKYGLVIDYDSKTGNLEIIEVEGVRNGKYSLGDLSFLKFAIDRFGSLKEFQKVYREFKSNNQDYKNIQEFNKAFRKEFGIPDRVPITDYLNDMINNMDIHKK